MPEATINKTDRRLRAMETIEEGELTHLKYVLALGPIATRTVDFLVNAGCALRPGMTGMPFELTQKGGDLLKVWRGGENGDK